MKGFEFRNISLEESDQAVKIEQICFPPNEACSEQMMCERVAKAPDLFFVAVEKTSGKIAGFLNGLATDESRFRDEFFTDATLHDPKGKNVLLLGLDVLPEYRLQGLATEIMKQYIKREQQKGRKLLLLTCLEEKVSMYEKMGFQDLGISGSTWGGEQWHEMSCALEKPSGGNYQRITHTFDPVYDRHSKILILGTLPSVKSRQQNFYYGHPQNRFWTILATLTKESIPETIEDKKQLALHHKIAIWDVIESCDIIGSSDSSIKNVIPTKLEKITTLCPDICIFANGKKAGELYQKYQQDIIKKSIDILPSTSPANAAYHLERLLEVWSRILPPLTQSIESTSPQSQSRIQALSQEQTDVSR